MSSIAGIYHLDQKPVDRVLLEQMLHCIPQRGADAAQIWANGSIGLAHRQFCTTEESLRESQPTWNRERTCWVTLDGRVDNRQELMDRLSLDLGKLQNPTDVDLLLHAYDKWGVECLRWVIGDYAFALWDSKRQTLFCGRDTYGIRPFYYHFDGKTFTFASDILQIFQNRRIELKVNDDTVADWFTSCGRVCYEYRDSSRTFFKGISELPSSHYIVISRSGLFLKRYWDVNENHLIHYRRQEEYVEHFRDVFREAVRCRLRSYGPVGAELSGGLDSSSVVCMAQEVYGTENANRKRLLTFSLVFDELTCDERPRINSVVEKYALESHYLTSDDLCGFRNFPPGDDCVFDLSHPEQTHTQEAIDVLYNLAAEHRVRVMLSGEGAENHVLGSPLVFDSLMRGFQWREIYRRLQTIPSWRARLSTFVRQGLIPLLPKSISVDRYYNTWMHPELYHPYLPTWVVPSFKEKIWKQIAEQREYLSKRRRFRNWAQQVEYEALNPGSRILTRYFPSNLLIERRFPYHDRRLVEFCLAIPPERKYLHLKNTARQSVRGRILQREGFRGILPETVRNYDVRVHFDDVTRRRAEKFNASYVKMFAPPASPLVAELGYIDGKQFWRQMSDCLLTINDGRDFDHRVWYWLNLVTKLEIWLQTMTAHQRSSRVRSIHSSWQHVGPGKRKGSRA